MATEVKICGLSDEDGVDAALAAGADYLGFVFFARSPRRVTPLRAGRLAARARGRAAIVALTVDAADPELLAIGETLRPDLLQLHGSEDRSRIDAVRALLGIPVMKALGVAQAGDLAAAEDHGADRLLLDAKPPRGATRPGGNGAAFDWSLLAGFAPGRPWFLSGGLHSGNVAEALRISGAPAVDVSSGVEDSPGRKDPERILAFVRAARAAGQLQRSAS